MTTDKYYCDVCGHQAPSKTHFIRHNNTTKHKDNVFKQTEVYKKFQEEEMKMKMELEIEKEKIKAEKELTLMKLEMRKIEMELEKKKAENIRLEQEKEEAEQKKKLLFNGQNENTSKPIDDINKITPRGSNFMDLPSFITDNDRLMVINSGFGYWFCDFLPRFIESIGGIKNSPIICSDVRRKKIFFHLKHVGWVEDFNLKRFTSFISYLCSVLMFGYSENITELRDNFMKENKIKDPCDYIGPLISWNYPKNTWGGINEDYCFKKIRDFSLEYLNNF